MKKIVYAVLSLISLTAMYSCSSGHYVSAQPEAVVVTRPVSPGANYVWVDGNYYWTGGRYVYRQGYWAQPRGGRIYRTGTWQQSPRGYYWRRGGWRR